jgi:hypothetical protein
VPCNFECRCSKGRGTRPRRPRPPRCRRCRWPPCQQSLGSADAMGRGQWPSSQGARSAPRAPILAAAGRRRAPPLRSPHPRPTLERNVLR